MVTLNTWGGRSSFAYTGSVKDGTTIEYGSGYSIDITKEDYAKLLKEFAGKIVDIGSSRDKAANNSVGKWLMENVSNGTAIAVYVGRILIEEGYAEKAGGKYIHFFDNSGIEDISESQKQDVSVNAFKSINESKIFVNTSIQEPSFSTSLSFEIIKKRIEDSNKNAMFINRNLYPVQEQATLMEIWELVPCECDMSCTCKRFGCTDHWKLKNGLNFEDICNGFVRMFVDNVSHDRLKRNIKDDKQSTGRIEGAYIVLKSIQKNWSSIYTEAAKTNKTLICSDWFSIFWKNLWDFSTTETIYRAKQFCIFLPDIGIPYDNKSRFKIMNYFGFVNNTPTYFKLLDKLRLFVIDLLKREKQTLSNFRLLDDPQIISSFNSTKIYLPKESFNYGNTYNPKERPLSRIIDKYFYQP